MKSHIRRDDKKKSQVPRRERYFVAHKIFKSVNFDSIFQFARIFYQRAHVLELELLLLVEYSSSIEVMLNWFYVFYVFFLSTIHPTRSALLRSRSLRILKFSSRSLTRGALSMLLRDRWMRNGNKCCCVQFLPLISSAYREATTEFGILICDSKWKTREWKSIILFDFKWKFNMPYGIEWAEDVLLDVFVTFSVEFNFHIIFHNRSCSQCDELPTT